MTLKPAILIIYNKAEVERVLLFDDHNDAVDTAQRFEQLKYGWSMYSFTHCKQGEIPEDAPPLQKTMFSEKE